VTVPVTATGGLEYGNNTWITMCSVTINLPEAQPIDIFWSFEQFYNASGGTWGVRFYNNSTKLFERTGMTARTDFPTSVFQMQGVSGNNVIELQWIATTQVQAKGKLVVTGFIR